MENSTMENQTSLHSQFTPGNAGITGYMLTCTALVFLMIPGVGYFYSGMARSKSALSLIMLSCWSMAIIFVQWFLFGYSLVFSKSDSHFIGNFDHVFLIDVFDQASFSNPNLPDLVFCFYQGMFAAITPALAIGAAAERARFLPATVFIFVWSTLVYDFLAYWTWNPNGWSQNMGGLDFAGGTPVHISSGAAALAYAVILGHREKTHDNDEFKPHNMSNVFLGTAFIWFGWFGFNGGSALQPNMQAAMSCYVSCLSAAVGGLTWVLLDYRHEQKYSALGLCVGAVAGLVCITPACGFVGPASSIVFGSVGAIACNMALNLKHILNFDDALDVFAVHGIGGVVGNILTGIFAQKKYANEIEGGWLDQNFVQILYQFIDTVAGLIWSFVVTFLILWVMNKIPGLSLRVDIEVERAGLDQGELGFNISEQDKSDRRRKKSVKGFNEPLGLQTIVRIGGMDNKDLGEQGCNISEQDKDDRQRKKSVKGFNEPLSSHAILETGGLDRREPDFKHNESEKGDRQRRKSVKGFNEPLGSQTILETGGLDHRELEFTINEADKADRQRRNGHSNVAFQFDGEQSRM